MGIALYQGGLSYEKSGEAVGVSRQAVKDWFDRAAAYFRSLRRWRRKRVARDEKVLHLPDGDAYLWAAADLDMGEVIALMVSRGRSGLEALGFLEKVRRKCAGRMPRVFIDGGESYPWALAKSAGRGLGAASGLERPRELLQRGLLVPSRLHGPGSLRARLGASLRPMLGGRTPDMAPWRVSHPYPDRTVGSGHRL